MRKVGEVSVSAQFADTVLSIGSRPEIHFLHSLTFTRRCLFVCVSEFRKARDGVVIFVTLTLYSKFDISLD